MALTPDQEQLKAALLATGETWDTTWENILRLDQPYFTAYLHLRQVPLTKRKLSRKVQELLLLAMDASCTHMYEPGVRAHTAAALKAGATYREILETLELTSVLGVHALTVGVPLLMEVLEENGQDISVPEVLDERREKLKQNFIAQRGYWSTSWPRVLQMSPDFFEAYTEYSSVGFQPGHSVLEPKVKELVFCAIDTSTTHLFKTGLKIHIRNALRLGATAEEVLEVFELGVLMGGQTVRLGVSVLAELGQAQARG